MTNANTPENADQDPLDSILSFAMEPVAASPKAFRSSIALTATQSSFDALVDDIHVLEGFNPRVETPELQEHIQSIARSILQNGYFRDKPLSVIAALKGKKPILYLVDGHCRLRGIQLAIEMGAPVEQVPVVVKDQSTTMEDLSVSVAMSNGGKRLTPFELGVICKRLNNAGWKNAKIAERIDKSPEYVGQLLKILGAPRSIRDRFQTGELAINAALALIREHGDDVSGVVSRMASSQTPVKMKNIPQVRRERVLKKFSPRIYATLSEIRQHTAFSALPDDIRSKVMSLIEEVERKAVVPPANASGQAEDEKQAA